MSPIPNVRVLAILGCILALPVCAAPKIPDTPAGHALNDWLAAFNTGDRDRIGAFVAAWSWDGDADSQLRWFGDTGPYELLDVYTNDRTHILFRLKGPKLGEEIGKIQVSATDPHVLTELGAFPVPAGSRFEAVTFDAKTQARVIGRLSDMLVKSYVIPETAMQMAAKLRERQNSADYRAVRDGRDFARLLVADLREVSHDPHLEIRYSYVVLPQDLNPPKPGDESKWLANINCGFVKSEHLRPNIGYVKFDMFANTKYCAPTASAAMNFVADSDALILDLRDNHGGGGGMPNYLASYLFRERTHLDDMWTRTTNVTTETWTDPDVPGRKFLDKPVYLLTANGTFSAAEYFANVLRNLHRVTLVGEKTGGGAHTVELQRVDDHFTIRLPTGKPITKTDWDGKGLEPDVNVPADQALEKAIELATAAAARAVS